MGPDGTGQCWQMEMDLQPRAPEQGAANTPPQPGTSMKTLALIALSLSICISLAGCIAPFRVKAREYAAAGTTAPKTPAPSIPAARPR